MNIKEFAALKVGDLIDNAASNSRGEVVSIDETGIRLRWVGAGRPDIPGNAVTWHYSAQSTAWFNWSKVEDVPQQSTAGEADTGHKVHIEDTPCASR